MDGPKVNDLKNGPFRNGPFKNGRSRTFNKWTVHKVDGLLKTNWPVQGSNGLNQTTVHFRTIIYKNWFGAS